MAKKVIKITCKGSGVIPLDQLQNFQGNLKTLDKSALEKLKRSLIKYGFSFPVFVWGNEILDGHQRIFAAKALIESGYTIGNIPVAEIEADSKKEAGEKLLMLNSHYAKMTDDGLYEFLNDFDIDISDLTDDLELPDINLDDFVEGYIDEQPNIDILESSGDLSGTQYGLAGSKSKVPFNILGVGGLVDREVMEDFKQSLMDSGAVEGEDNGDVIKQKLLEVI